MNRKTKNVFHLIILIAVINIGCKNKSGDVDDNSEVKQSVSAINPSFQNITEYITLNGVTVFQKKNNIRSTNTGYITSLKFKPGDLIKSGQIFCLLGTKEQEALKSISTIDTSLNKFQKPISVPANGSGVITAISVLQGDYVSEGDVLATFSEPTSLIVQVNVPYEYNKFVSIGKNCDIRLPDDRIIHTSIMGVMPSVDVTTQSQTFFVRLPDLSLPENLNVTIHISEKQKNNLLCVPSKAVQTNETQDEFWLMKVVNDTVAVKVPVKIGLQNDSITEITSGDIKSEDKIVMDGAYGLADSSLIIISKE